MNAFVDFRGTPAQRFAKRCSEPDANGCINWTGSRKPDGYAQFNAFGHYPYVHRFAWEQVHGPIPEGLEIDHTCKNRLCVNVAHLEAVTKLENIRRSSVGSNMACRTHCPQGHPYDEANTIRKGGSRHCRECHRLYMVRYHSTRQNRTVVAR